MGAIPGITGTGGEVAARASQPHRPGSGVLVGAPGCAQTPRWGGGKPPKIQICGFFSTGWSVYIPNNRNGALGYLEFNRHLMPTCQQFRKLLAYEYGKGCLCLFGLVFFLNHCYYYLIVHLFWYWAGQLGSGADLPRPWVGARPTLAATSPCKASPLGTSPPGRRATVGILLADGGFPGHIYIYIYIITIFCCCRHFFRLKNPLQLSPRW